MAYEELKSSGITTNTPGNIMLGAGTIHRGLAFADGVWNFEESLAKYGFSQGKKQSRH